MTLLRPFLAFVALLLAALGCATGSLTVTSPAQNDYLGTSNTVSFAIAGASVKVTVKVTATAPDGTTTSTQNDFVPSNGSIDGTLPLNFTSGAVEGSYTVVVSATENGIAYTPVTRSVTVDVTAPKFTELSPVDGGFTRGLIQVRAALSETHLKTWTVTVNGQSIPNGTGQTTTISVDYDATNLTSDGAQAISIVATDLAGNTTTKNISITLDRIKPTVQIVYPTGSSRISNGQDVTVLIDITDASSSSVDKTGIDVLAKKTDGTYITRVTLVSLKATNGTTQRWTGRIRYQKGLLPSQFKISASVIDRAGNNASLQEVTARYGN